MKNESIKLKIKILFVLLSIFVSCTNRTPEEQKYLESILQYRSQKNEYMKNNPESPFNFKLKVEFHDLNYFDVNYELRFKSKLFPYLKKDTIIIFGTKGEPRETVRFGYLTFNYKNRNYKLNVYESEYSGNKYYSIWFTDRTTNKESYGVGRYLDFELSNDKDFLYEIDFNLAYNPYCAYSKEYSCAIPTKEDYIDLEINAGEKKFHE